MKDAVKKIATIGVILLGMLIAMFYLIYQEYEYTYVRESRVIEATDLAENELTKSLYKSFKREAQNKTDRVAEEIRATLINKYNGDMDKFVDDYDSPTEQSILVTTIDSVINDSRNRFYYVESDANDMFALSKKQILADQSKDCSSEGSAKPIDEVVEFHYNQPLARQSIDGLINDDKSDLFWQFKNTSNIEEPKIKSMDIEKVLELPLDELKDYEFLTVSYIDKYGDIMGTKDVNSLGSKKDSKKLMIVQGFNIYDQVQDGFKPSYTRLAKNQKLQIAIIKENRKGLATKLFLMIALVLISFVSMAIIQDIYVKGCGVDVKSK